MASIDLATFPYRLRDRTGAAISSLKRSRRLNTVLLVIILLLLAAGFLGGAYLYTYIMNLPTTAGVAGEPGARGPKGAPGSDGAPGPAGLSGTDGKNGQDGDGSSGGVDSGQGVIDLGACDPNVDIRVRSELVSGTFYLSTVTLSGISAECEGQTIDLYVLGGDSPDWTTLTSSAALQITGDTLVINAEQFDVDLVPSEDITRIALEIQ